MDGIVPRRTLPTQCTSLHLHTYQWVLVSVHCMEQVSQLVGWGHSRKPPCLDGILTVPGPLFLLSEDS